MHTFFFKINCIFCIDLYKKKTLYSLWVRIHHKKKKSPSKYCLHIYLQVIFKNRFFNRIINSKMLHWLNLVIFHYQFVTLKCGYSALCNHCGILHLGTDCWKPREYRAKFDLFSANHSTNHNENLMSIESFKAKKIPIVQNNF